jgi:lipopolysaccharide transport system permease protein
MIAFLESKRYWIEFLLTMTEKEIKARYKLAILGFLWIILNPVLQMLVIGMIFQFIVNSKIEHYFIFLLAGLLNWNFFSLTLTRNTAIIVNERGLIHKAKFPRESIVLSVVLANLFHTLIAYSLLSLIAVFFVSVSLLKVVLFGVAVSQLLMITAGLSLFCSALNVRYRDVSFFVNAAVPLIFYCTPIVYTRAMLPEILQQLLLLNPLTFSVEALQFVYTGSPDVRIGSLLFSSFFCIFIFIIGWSFFQKKSGSFDDWI